LKNIIFFTFYYKPDLCAGSFRNTSLSRELAAQLGPDNHLTIITTSPNRYNTFKVEAPAFETFGNVSIYRIKVPEHQSGFFDQILTFYAFYKGSLKVIKRQKFDLVYASSSRMFTAYLGYVASRKGKVPLYIDVRDIFLDTMRDVLKSRLLKFFVLPVMAYIEKKVFNHATHINLISGGFAGYFRKFKGPDISYFFNGVDDDFLALDRTGAPPGSDGIKRITYAGNIGEGQGLDIIIPAAAKALGPQYEFIVVGDGGTKSLLVNKIKELGVTNVVLLNPVQRAELIELYRKSDFLFIHLNRYRAFEKVLPSKLFELAAFDKPLIAGVGGYARNFIEENITNVIIFDPGDTNTFIEKLRQYKYHLEDRAEFIAKFQRSNVNQKMAQSILSYLD